MVPTRSTCSRPPPAPGTTAPGTTAPGTARPRHRRHRPQVKLLKDLDKFERLTIADAVSAVDFEAGTDIITEGWYDYDAKYKPGGSRHEVPAQVPAAVFDACLDFALRAHAALGCQGLSRTDFRWDERLGVDGLILLETNTQPGMTPTSLSPEQAEFCGTSFGALCRWLVEDASCNR